MKFLIAFVVFTVALASVQGQVAQVAFTLSAEHIPSMDGQTPADPYVKVYTYRANTAPVSLEKIGKTSIVLDSNNPQWPEAFTVSIAPRHSQKIRFEVVDADLATRNDVIGFADIDADELVNNRGAVVRAALSSGGVIVVTPTNPFRFKLNANNVPRKDRYWGYDGPSDPYVEIYFREGQNGTDTFLATSSTIDNSDNPTWPEEFEFNQFRRGGNQYLFFKIYDYDSFTADDFIGQGLIKAEDLVDHRVSNTLNIGAKNVAATLTIRLV